MPRGNPAGYNRYGDPKSGVKAAAKRKPPASNPSAEGPVPATPTGPRRTTATPPGRRVGRNPAPGTPRKVGKPGPVRKGPVPTTLPPNFGPRRTTKKNPASPAGRLYNRPRAI